MDLRPKQIDVVTMAIQLCQKMKCVYTWLSSKSFRDQMDYEVQELGECIESMENLIDHCKQNVERIDSLHDEICELEDKIEALVILI